MPINVPSLPERQAEMKARMRAPAAEKAKVLRVAKKQERVRKCRSRWIHNRSPLGRSGWVYLVQIIDGPIKIGLTFDSDPFPRIQRVDFAVPYPTQILGICKSEDAGALERAIHDRCDRYRIKGEWFKIGRRTLGRLKSQYPFQSAEEVRALIQPLADSSEGLV